MGFEGKVAITRHEPGVWSLNRKARQDGERHQEKLRDAVREQLPHVVTSQPIKTPQGDVIKVPIHQVDLPRFRYDFGRNKHIGQGNGNSKPGDGVGQGDGKGNGAGDGIGLFQSEVWIPVAEAEKIVFEGWELPGLQPKTSQRVVAEDVVFDDIRRNGPMSMLDRKRTLKANMARNARQFGEARVGNIRQDDLRFRATRPITAPQTNAVVIAMRDVSSSMGEFQKESSRSFYYWMDRFLKSRYEGVETVFIAHDTQAREVDQDTFFALSSSGGTKVSPAYQLALDIVHGRYSPEQWNIYPFHFTDGDNDGFSDNERSVEKMRELVSVSNMVGYGDIRGGSNLTSNLKFALEAIKDPKLKTVSIRKQEDVYSALKSFFSASPAEGAVSRV